MDLPFFTSFRIFSFSSGDIFRDINVYVDRGFFDSKAIKVFQRFHLKYLMPAMQISTVKEMLEIAPSPSVIKEFPMKDVTFNLVIVEEKLKDGKIVKRAFATNEEYDENDVKLAERLFL